MAPDYAYDNSSGLLGLQLDAVELQRPPDRALQLGDRLVEIGARAQLGGLCRDVRRLPLQDQEDGADAGVEAAALARVLLECVAARRRRGGEPLLRRADGLERVPYLRLD